MKDKNELEKLGKTANMLKSQHIGRDRDREATFEKKMRSKKGREAYEDASFIPLLLFNKQILNVL